MSDRPMKKHGESSFKLRLPVTWKSIYHIFNECVVSRYTSPQFPSQVKSPPPPLGLVEGQPKQEIGEILYSGLEMLVLVQLNHVQFQR
ncbi:hypothetical protein PAXRUDRAFT_833468 [Paxillus rubicundulus Ve08.2h10]|uniref:Uncharacterized protein n=1 Tax=Paxillus rubicundulus Ve08.2h10 TaxID=930991 RepID=A0A0D0CCN7_9AGAM|nr:hypothetical protein PAXRUDRAFT_833468 [Paxillus rubicundulus Ve08.2h10]